MPKSRSVLVSFSVKTSSGAAPPTGSTEKRNRPSDGCATSMAPGPDAASDGFSSGRRYPSPCRPHDQLLANQSVGSSTSGAAAGPRLATVTVRQRSSGEALACSSVTSK